LEHYIVRELIADGEITKVSLAKTFQGSPVIIKKINKKEVEAEWVENEINAGKTLKHEGLVNFRDHFEDNENHYLVLDYVVGKDLLTFLEDREFQCLPEVVARTIFRQLVTSIQYCHSKGVSHKDLKLENIMVDRRMRCSLIDFGLCEFVSTSGISSRWAGTLEYCPPEVLKKQAYCPYKADVFTLGVVLFTILCGVLPFDLKKRWQVIQRGEKPVVCWNEFLHVSKEAKDLLNGLLEADPKQRIGLEEIFNSPWMKMKTFTIHQNKTRLGHKKCRNTIIAFSS